MSKPNKPNDDALLDLYRQRKNQHSAPASIKRAVLAAHQSMFNHRQIWQRIGHVAVAASTLLLCTLVFWHYKLWQTDEPQLSATQYTTVELHSLAAEQQSTAITERYAKHYQDYLSQQQVLALHHTKQAVLRQTEGDWQIQTCDQQIVQVSQELITALRNLHQIDGNLKNGDSVELLFDKNGIILGINQSQTYMHC
ncbi:hypothetical protein [Paraglaciecola hydrolytica]|uniref:Uncharacterized protein n=1 Tax=Paraglaciecola hydrolytica TaxID=1799789 RepID=A0A135ZYN2_9ALTE|nr:hypothetical protein [Paraglaciecola hydrolytica]KXI28098.1 hypothetical protein AX660_17070 [Paraglaciecola hydrolytica]